MSEYKMSDVFDLPVSVIERGDQDYFIVDKDDASKGATSGVFWSEMTSSLAANAINNHDRLTAQVDALKALLELAGGMGFNTVTSQSGITHRDYCDRVDKLLTRIGEDNDSIQ